MDVLYILVHYSTSIYSNSWSTFVVAAKIILVPLLSSISDSQPQSPLRSALDGAGYAVSPLGLTVPELRERTTTLKHVPGQNKFHTRSSISFFVKKNTL